MEKITLINQAIKKYFEDNPSVKIIPAKDLMPQFIKVGIFLKDDKNGLPIRKILRGLDQKNQLKAIPYVVAERKAVNTNWFFSPSGKPAEVSAPTKVLRKTTSAKIAKTTKTADSDENYVLNICDEVLKLKGLRQHRFDFLVGDSGTKLPVDVYYPTLNLVVEYRETQHTNAVKHFDKPDVMTVSGVHRGEQRKIYDQRRRDVLPKHGIKLVEIGYSDFEFDRRNRILRNREMDLELLEEKLRILKNKKQL